VSRHPFKDQVLDDAGQSTVDLDDGVSHQRHGEIAAEARAMFADQAATAVAFCGLEAWFDGQTGETRQWADILRRLKH
jgi:hypothetical protein